MLHSSSLPNSRHVWQNRGLLYVHHKLNQRLKWRPGSQTRPRPRDPFDQHQSSLFLAQSKWISDSGTRIPGFYTIEQGRVFPGGDKPNLFTPHSRETSDRYERYRALIIVSAWHSGSGFETWPRPLVCYHRTASLQLHLCINLKTDRYQTFYPRLIAPLFNLMYKWMPVSYF